MAGVTLNTFEPERRKRCLVERGLEIISEASRHLPAALKAATQTFPGRKWSPLASLPNPFSCAQVRTGRPL
jgi:uncharacterized protein with HEPN domain